METGDAGADLWLAPHIHVARDGGDLVVLDVEADAYYCLPGAADALSVEADGGKLKGLPAEVVEALAAIGAVAKEATTRRSPVLEPPQRDLTGRLANDLRAREVWDLALSVLEGVIRFRSQDLKALVSGWTRVEVRDRAALERRALIFRTLWPWSPVQGACLFQALVLRLFLRRAGLDGDWVFGVRTWPFSAHCWLQSEDLVLNDLAERVGAYRPIMVV